MISVRLPDDLEQKVNQISKKDHISKSELIKDALLQYIDQYEDTLDSFKIGNQFFGKYASENSNFSTTYKQRIREKLNEKYSH